MDTKTIAVLATAGAGGLVAMQAPINSGLGKSIGSLPAASFSFAIGLVALLGDHVRVRRGLRRGSARSGTCPGTT